MKWQPIATAPSKKPVLIFDGKIICVACRGYNAWNCVGASAWAIENDFSDPTHWMALPEPPKEKP